MNLHHLELFYHVARSGGISRALRHIPYGIQQPAVSIQILALEESLGTRLFDRQPFRLTAEGRELYEFARPFFEQIDALEARLRQKRTPLFRIAASELVLREYLPAVMHEMKQRHPELRFRLRSGMQAEVERWLLESEIDLAILPLDARPKAGLRSAPLARLPLVLIVPEASEITSASQLWTQSPLRHPLICVPPGECITKLFYRGLRQLKVDWPTSIEASGMDLVTRYVASGYGIGVTVDLPAFAAVPGVRAIKLPGFDPVEFALLWCGSPTALHQEVRELIAAQATALFPAAAKVGKAPRARR